MNPLKSIIILDLLEAMSKKHEIYWLEEDMSFLRELVTVESEPIHNLTSIKFYYRQPRYDGANIQIVIDKQEFVFYYSPTLQDEFYSLLRGYTYDTIRS